MDTAFTCGAIAYLKALIPPGSPADLTLSGDDSPIIRDIGDGLCICYVVDDGTQYVYAQERHLKEDDLSSDDLHQIGISNLWRLAGTREVNVHPHGSVFAVTMGGDFEASLILLDELWEEQFRQFVHGEYAVAVPNRDILAFTDAGSHEGIVQLQSIIDRIHRTGDHPIAECIYLRQGKRWMRRQAQPGATDNPDGARRFREDH